MILDVPTLAVLAVLIGFEFAVGFVVVASMLGRQPGLRQWAAGAALMFTGAMVWVFHFLLPELLLIVVSHTLLFAGLAAIWAGTRDFCGLSYTLRPFWLGIGPFLGALVWFSTAAPSTGARVVVYSLAVCAWSLAVAWTFFRRAPDDLRKSAWIVGGLFLLHASFYLARCFFPQEGELASAMLQPGWPRMITGVETIVSSTARLLAVVALLGHRLMLDLERAARIDILTGALNRGALEAEGARVVELSVGLGLPCTALLLDLDHFKRVNDTHGHPAGDAALRHFASLVGKELRSSDLFGRYGGEEFVALLPGTGAAEARIVAERLRGVVAASPAIHDRVSIELTVSIGVAWGAGPGLEFEGLVSRADEALYRAKGGGRDRVIEAVAA